MTALPRTMRLPHYEIDLLLEGVDGILFDMDGVLLDTEDLYTEATRRVLGPLGERFDFRVKEKIMGRAPDLAARILLEAVGSELTPEEYVKAREPIITELFARCAAIPGAPDLVAHLARRGVPLAVATSSDRHYFRVKTSHHPWFEHFSAVVCGSDPEVKQHKPAPDIFLAAARRLGLSCADCLVVEDSPAGVQAARAAGAKRIVVRQDPRMDPALLAGGDVYLLDFGQILF